MLNKVLGKGAALGDVRSLFQNHIIRFRRSAAAADSPITVKVDFWNLEDTYPNMELATAAAEDYIRNLGD